MPGGMGVSTGDRGLVKSIEEAAGAPIRLGWLPDAEQLELLRAADGSLSRGAIHQVRTRGRPRGARNKRQKKIADYYVAKYGDPLDAIGQLANTPLRQLVEVLMEADGGAEREERLFAMVEEAISHIKSLRKVDGANVVEVAGALSDAIEKLANAAKAINGKPGKLALDALIVQMTAHKTALEYVHGKQSVSIEVTGKADLVVFAPELLRQHGVDPGELQAAIAERGLEAFDTEEMRLLPPIEDGEFSEAEGDE